MRTISSSLALCEFPIPRQKDCILPMCASTGLQKLWNNPADSVFALLEGGLTIYKRKPSLICKYK